MEKLLALKRLKLVRIERENKLVDYIYSDQLLKRNILIECDSNSIENNLIATDITVITYDKTTFNRILVYSKVEDQCNDIVLYGIICTLSEIIDQSPIDQLNEYLQEISDGGFSSEYGRTQEEKNQLYQSFFKLIIEVTGEISKKSTGS